MYKVGTWSFFAHCATTLQHDWSAQETSGTWVVAGSYDMLRDLNLSSLASSDQLEVGEGTPYLRSCFDQTANLANTCQVVEFSSST